MSIDGETEPDDDIELATRLLAEWDKRRGTSKGEIEWRERGDGGAHGRRFDRFIRQTLGVAIIKPSRQTDRTADLEAQLRRLSTVPVDLDAPPTATIAEFPHRNAGRRSPNL